MSAINKKHWQIRRAEPALVYRYYRKRGNTWTNIESEYFKVKILHRIIDIESMFLPNNNLCANLCSMFIIVLFLLFILHHYGPYLSTDCQLIYAECAYAQTSYRPCGL